MYAECGKKEVETKPPVAVSVGAGEGLYETRREAESSRRGGGAWEEGLTVYHKSDRQQVVESKRKLRVSKNTRHIFPVDRHAVVPQSRGYGVYSHRSTSANVVASTTLQIERLRRVNLIPLPCHRLRSSK